MSSPPPILEGMAAPADLAVCEPVRDEHDVASTLGRRAIGDAQVPVHRIARLREHGGSLSRAGRAVRSAAFMLLTSVPLKCSSASRCHHLLKTFWGWRDRQHPDATVVWTSPHGQTYTTHPGIGCCFPRLCRPTAAVTTFDIPPRATDPNPTTRYAHRRRTPTQRNLRRRTHRRTRQTTAVYLPGTSQVARALSIYEHPAIRTPEVHAVARRGQHAAVSEVRRRHEDVRTQRHPPGAMRHLPRHLPRLR